MTDRIEASWEERSAKILESNARIIETSNNTISELKSLREAAVQNISAMQDLAIHLKTAQIEAQQRHNVQMEHLGRLIDLLVTQATPN
jgi:hypothetical protein